VTRSLRRLTDPLIYRLNPMRDSCLGEGDPASSTLRRFRPSAARLVFVRLAHDRRFVGAVFFVFFVFVLFVFVRISGRHHVAARYS
jgi:hypothetical protein